MKNACVRGVLVFFMCVVCAAIVFAQSDLGTISGFVRDPSGATVPNAKVTLRNQNQAGSERVVTTNESGYYTVTNIPAGSYAVTVEAAGFEKYESRDNKLDPSAHLSI